MKPLELKGQRFGRLTVIESAGIYPEGQRWSCLCDCGGLTVVRGGNLTNGHVRSCGCLRVQTGRQNGERTGRDISGQIHGRLKVLRRNQTNSKHHLWHFDCQCLCGRMVTVAGTRLTTGRTKSCGQCIRRKASRINLSGKRFGRLFVLGVVTDKRPDGSVMWVARCNCGIFRTVNGCSLRYGKTKSCGCLARELNTPQRLREIQPDSLRAQWYPNATREEYLGLLKAKKLWKGLKEYVRQQRNENQSQTS